MNRILAPLSTGLLLAAAAQAQCFETDFGTLIGTGDDTLLATVPMNMNFPMGGAFATYDFVRVNTNGCAFLWNGSGTPTGSVGGGYSTSPATMVTNLQGAAGGGPRIAPYWRDLNILAGNNGGVWVNNSYPGKCIITWANAVHWNVVETPFTIQAQLFDTGDVQFFYDGILNNTNIAPIAGISQGGGIADPGITDLSVATAGVSVSPIVYETFGTALTWDLATTAVWFLPNAGTGYDSVPIAGPFTNCVHASHENYGKGCYTQFETFYQFFEDAAVASAALQGNSLLMTPGANGYTANWLPGTAGALYVAPTGGATSLVPNDDGNEVVTPPSIPLPVPGGVATDFTVSHNGVVTLGLVANNGTDFNITGPEVASATGAAFYAFSDWRDNNTTPVASGTIKTEEVGGIYYITWDGVDHWATPQVSNPSTFQFQFDLNTGNVTIVWVTVDTNTTSQFFSTHLVGYTGPGAGNDPGSIDLATDLPLTTGPDQAPAMSLSAAPAPRINPSTVVTYTANDVPEFQPASGVYLSTMFLSVNPLPGGFDVFGILTGTPGCNAYIATLDLDLGAQVTFGPTATWNFTFSNAVFSPGNVIAAQAVSLYDGAFPLFNGESGGFVLSNGVLSTTQID